MVLSFKEPFENLTTPLVHPYHPWFTLRQKFSKSFTPRPAPKEKYPNTYGYDELTFSEDW